MPGRYFEDYAVGQKFGSGTVAVTAERIKSFGREFDPQPFHTDEEAARHSFFGGLVASGWHTAAMSMRLFVDSDITPAGGLDRRGWVRPRAGRGRRGRATCCASRARSWSCARRSPGRTSGS